MLQKRRVTNGSIPDGLMDVAVENLKKGMIVGRKLNSSTGEYEIVYCTSGVKPYGFVTLREDEAVYAYSHYDAIEKGVKATVYTMVKDHEWATDQFKAEDSLKQGDKVKAGTTGLLEKDSTGSDAIGEVIGTQDAMAGYENAMVVVKLY